MLKKFFIALIFLLLTGYLFLSYSLSNRILEPHSSLERTKGRIQSGWGTTFEAIMDSMPEPEVFTLEGVDGVPLKGRYFRMNDTANCAIIFAHGWSSTWAGMLKYVPPFEECGCDLVLYDHRSHGESGKAHPTAGIKEKEDLWRVTEWTQAKLSLSSQQIGWMGASWGAATALQAGASEKDVAFIVADAPYQDWYSAIFERALRDYGSGIHAFSFGVMSIVNWRAEVDYTQASPINLADQITEPVLLIHSRGDLQTNSQQSVNISKRLKAQTSIFHHLDWGNDHTKDVIANREGYTQLVQDFLKEKVKGFGECGGQ
jgi:dipeptidyl aminopeptidase/acylaminoacyl peptidase